MIYDPFIRIILLKRFFSDNNCLVLKENEKNSVTQSKNINSLKIEIDTSVVLVRISDL